MPDDFIPLPAAEAEIRQLSLQIVDINGDIATSGYKLALIGQRVNLAKRLAMLAFDVLPEGHRRGTVGGLTILDTVVEVLRAGPPEGMALKDIRKELSVRAGRTIPRTSISPVLTKLRERGTVRANDRIWTLSSR